MNQSTWFLLHQFIYFALPPLVVVNMSQKGFARSLICVKNYVLLSTTPSRSDIYQNHDRSWLSYIWPVSIDIHYKLFIICPKRITQVTFSCAQDAGNITSHRQTARLGKTSRGKNASRDWRRSFKDGPEPHQP